MEELIAGAMPEEVGVPQEPPTLIGRFLLDKIVDTGNELQGLHGPDYSMGDVFRSPKLLVSLGIYFTAYLAIIVPEAALHSFGKVFKYVAHRNRESTSRGQKPSGLKSGMSKEEK